MECIYKYTHVVNNFTLKHINVHLMQYFIPYIEFDIWNKIIIFIAML